MVYELFWYERLPAVRVFLYGAGSTACYPVSIEGMASRPGRPTDDTISASVGVTGEL